MDLENNEKIIEKLLATAPREWHKQFRSGITKATNPAVGMKLPLTIDNALRILGITAGGNASGDVPLGVIPVPDAVRQEAMKGLILSHRNNYGAWDFIGIARAIQLATQPGIPQTTVTRMRNYFSRHKRDRLSAHWEDTKKPSRGWMAHLNWGGDAGERWVNTGAIRNPWYSRRNAGQPSLSEAYNRWIASMPEIKDVAEDYPVINQQVEFAVMFDDLYNTQQFSMTLTCVMPIAPFSPADESSYMSNIKGLFDSIRQQRKDNEDKKIWSGPFFVQLVVTLVRCYRIYVQCCRAKSTTVAENKVYAELSSMLNGIELYANNIEASFQPSLHRQWTAPNSSGLVSTPEFLSRMSRFTEQYSNRLAPQKNFGVNGAETDAAKVGAACSTLFHLLFSLAAQELFAGDNVSGRVFLEFGAVNQPLADRLSKLFHKSSLYYTSCAIMRGYIAVKLSEAKNSAQ